MSTAPLSSSFLHFCVSLVGLIAFTLKIILLIRFISSILGSRVVCLMQFWLTINRALYVYNRRVLDLEIPVFLLRFGLIYQTKDQHTRSEITKIQVKFSTIFSSNLLLLLPKFNLLSIVLRFIELLSKTKR